MPIYAYQCAACGHDFDRLQKMSDPDPDACPVCGATGSVRRQLTAPSFRLAGSGWYETDFKKDGDRKRNLVEGKEAAKPEATGEGKPSDAKADSKPSDTAKAPEKKAEPAKAEPKPAAKPASSDG